MPKPARFKMPTDLAALSAEELANARTAALAAFDEMRESDAASLSNEDITQMNELVAGIESIDAEGATRAEALAERSSTIAALNSRVRPEGATEQAAAGGDNTEQLAPLGSTDDGIKPAPGNVEVGGPVPTKFAADGADGVPHEHDGLPPHSHGEDGAVADGGEGVTPHTHGMIASGRPPARTEDRRVLAEIARRKARPAPVNNSGAKARIRAGNDVMALTASGEDYGTFSDLKQVGVAAQERVKTFPKRDVLAAAGRRNEQIHGQSTIAYIDMPFDDSLVASSGMDQDIAELLHRAADQDRLPGGSLTASGGWCAPSEVLYDLCVTETVWGLVSVPEVQVQRGGIKFTKGPKFSDIFGAAAFWEMTEATDIAGSFTKPCFHVPCPAFEEVRLEAMGVCITAGILEERAYPELVRRWVDGALIAHQYRRSLEIIGNVQALIVAETAAVTMPAMGDGATTGILRGVELLAEYERELFALGGDAVLEVWLPMWVEPLIRADLSVRAYGGTDMLDVSDADIESWFTERKLRVQWLSLWQSLAYTANSTDPELGTTVAAVPTAWPTTVTALIVPAGAFVVGTESIIRLDAVYDSTLFRQNDYTALFTEEGILVAKRCWGGLEVHIPICPSGATSLPVAITC